MRSVCRFAATATEKRYGGDRVRRPGIADIFFLLRLVLVLVAHSTVAEATKEHLLLVLFTRPADTSHYFQMVFLFPVDLFV